MKRALLLLIILMTGTLRDLQAQDILFPAKSNNQWGFIDKTGTWIIPPEFSEALEFTEGLAPVKSYSTWGYIDSKGKWIIEPQFELAVPFNEGVAAVVFNNRWGFIDHQGNFTIEPIFHKASSFSEGLALVSIGEGYFFITHKGDQVGKEVFDHALPFAEGMASIIVNSEKGYIDNNGNLTFKHQYESAAPYSEGRAQVRKNGKWGFIDRNGNTIIPLEYASSGHFSEGYAAVAKKSKWGYIDKRGTLRIKAEFDQANPFSFGYASVKSKGEYGIIDKNSNWILDPGYEFIGQAGRSESLREVLIKKIQMSFSEWSIKGEFEKTDEYIDRLSPDNQKLAMKEISDSIINDYGESAIDFEHAELGYYDADNEGFNIFIPGALPSKIKVPISEALWFKENWRNGQFGEAKFMLAGESLIISDYIFTISKKNYTYSLEEHEGYLYNYASISWEEEISVPEISWNVGVQDELTKVVPGASDVDSNIPVGNFQNRNTFALIIGNEDYNSFQSGLNDEIDVSFAVIDAEVFSKYANRTLGIPLENITLIRNGTAGQIKQALAKMNSIAKAYEGNAEFIFYYAGHGLPDEKTGKPYLIPVDVNGSDLSFAISLDDALNTLTEYDHKRVTVFLDACFTGGARNQALIASRGVKIKPKSAYVKGNLVVFSASSGNQSAFSYEAKGHGMFTYFLLKKLQESGGNVTYGELANYIQEKVRKNAIIYNNKEQDPEMIVSPALEDSWEQFKLNMPYRPELEEAMMNR